MSMYLSNKPSEFEELFYNYLKCDVVYSTLYKGGTVYCVSHTNPTKSHSTLDNVLQSIESDIEPGWVDSKFQCISNYLSKKVKTFTVGEHLSDELYNAIFTSTTMGCRGEMKVHPYVKTWHPPNNKTDKAVQLKPPKRKRVVAAVADTGKEHYGTVDGVMVETQVAQIACVDIVL